MATNNAFTAGVKPGGLTSNTEIRLLLCYIIKNIAGLTRDEIENALLEESLVNYFEIASGLADILAQKLAMEANGCYFITAKGEKVAAEIAYDLPASVRESAIAAAVRKQTWNKKAAEYRAEISQRDGGSYNVKCTIAALPEDAFCLQLAMPDKATAKLVQEQFILKGNEIYAMLLTKLSEKE